MKKHSMRILGLLLFLSVAFVQDSFSQDFKPMADAQAAVEAELINIDSNVNVLDGTAASDMRIVLPEFMYDLLAELPNSASTESAYNSVYQKYYQTYVNVNGQINQHADEVISAVSDHVNSLITE